MQPPLAIAAAFLALGLSVAEAARFDFDATPGRLPKEVVPTRYQLEFELDPARDIFSGRADIAFTVRQPVARIVLNANRLQAIAATLVDAAGARRALQISADEAQTQWQLSWGDNYLFGGALIRVREPALVRKLLELTLTDEWPPESAVWYAGHVGAASGHVRPARDFVLRNFSALQAKSSTWGRSWLLPNVYQGFNDARYADELLAEQRRALGADALAPAEQVAATIREKAAVRAREGEQFARLLRSLATSAARGRPG